jgi:hypothetical protein
MKMYAESMLENVMQKTSTTIRKVTPKWVDIYVNSGKCDKNQVGTFIFFGRGGRHSSRGFVQSAQGDLGPRNIQFKRPSAKQSARRTTYPPEIEHALGTFGPLADILGPRPPRPCGPTPGRGSMHRTWHHCESHSFTSRLYGLFPACG